jgi:ribose transport system substrate-binding protein
MKKKVTSFALCLAIVGSLLSGTVFGSETETEGASLSTQDDYKNIDMSGYKVDGMSIGVSFGQNVHPFFKAMQKGIEDACKDYGIDKVSIQSADSALETQVTQIENLTSSGITSLLVNPYDSQGVAVAVQNAIDAGVSVFSMDISVDGAEPTYHISSDNVKIGELLAEHLDEMLGGKGKIAILVDPSVSSLKDRAQGFEDYIADTDIEIVAEQTGAVERTDALENAETILQAHSDIDAFIGINEATATGIASAIDAQGLSDKGIIVTGVDATEDVMNGIKNGTISFAVAQNPYQMGYMSVQNAIKVYNGEKVESVTQLACEIMDQSNVDYYVEREAQYND